MKTEWSKERANKLLVERRGKKLYELPFTVETSNM